MARVFGVGPGTFLLAFLWTLSTIIAFFFAKSRGNYVPGLSCYLLTSAATSILLSLRTTGDGTAILAQDDDLGYDKMFIPRLVILLFTIISVIIGTVGLHVTWWMIPIKATPLRERSELKERISRERESAPMVKKDNFVSRQQEINKLRRRF